MLEDSKGNMWFGSYNEGACKYDGASFTYYTTKDGLLHNQVRTIQEDKYGHIWFGTASGPCSFDGTKIIQHDIIDTPSLVNLSVHYGTIDSEDRWFHGGNYAGLYRYHDSLLTFLPFSIPDGTDEVSPYLVTGIARSTSKNLYFCTYNYIGSYDGKRFRFVGEKELGKTELEGHLHIRSIYLDTKGRLWVGNNSIGILRKNGITFENFSSQQNLRTNPLLNHNSLPSTNPLEHVFAIGEDNKGNIWFGDRDTGAWRYDGKNMKNYSINDGLPCAHIWQIYNSKQDGLLFAMGCEGVYKFNGTGFEQAY